MRERERERELSCKEKFSYYQYVVNHLGPFGEKEMYIHLPRKFTLIYSFFKKHLFVKYLFVPEFMLSLRNRNLKRMTFAVKELVEGNGHTK